MGEHAAALAQDRSRFDVACEALLVSGVAAGRRDTDLAARTLRKPCH